MTPIGFDPSTGNIIIQGNGVFPAGSLTATISDVLPDAIQINDLAGRGEQLVAWRDVTSLDWSFVPSDMMSAFDYLQIEFTKGPSFKAIPAPYPLAGAASFAINHGLSYVPSTTILDATGAEIDTDVAHAPGQTVLTFAQPFTGTLYLG